MGKMRRLLSMRGYFAMNPTIFHNNNIKTMPCTNKMSTGKGRAFSEGWLRDILDRNATPAQKIFNTAKRAWINMGNLKQDKEDT